jgi:hypothetical protein
MVSIRCTTLPGRCTREGGLRWFTHWMHVDRGFLSRYRTPQRPKGRSALSLGPQWRTGWAPTSSHSCHLSLPLYATPEQVDNFVIERRDVVGFATRNEISVDDHFPIDPFRPSILQIALE